MKNANGLAELRLGITWWGEYFKVCTECGEHVTYELRTVVDGREYHQCRTQPVREPFFARRYA